MSSLSDISNKHQQEFETLRSNAKKKSIGKALVLYLVCMCIGGLVFTALLGRWDNSQKLEASRAELSAYPVPWVRQIMQQEETLRAWIYGHGTAGEVALFTSAADLVFQSAKGLAQKNQEKGELGIFSNLYLSLHFGILRVIFLILACWRLWLFVAMWSGIWGLFSLKVFVGNDMLGMTGNGRLFYSGIRAGLHKVTPFGAPDVQVTGLACPRSEPENVTRASPLGTLLSQNGVDNSTNIGLSGIILQHANWPGYVALSEDESLLGKFYEGTSLPKNAALILEKALELQKFYRQGSLEEAPPFLAKFDLPSPETKVSAELYASMLQHSFHRVLTPSMRKMIAETTPRELATLVLAYEAGKILTYAHQGGRWIRRSNYGQLNARAILHSVHHWGKEYDFDSRLTLRRAIIYGSRMGAFAPVHLPVDLSFRSRALRQWVELLMCCPHELHAVADEVEMIGIIFEVHRDWSEKFFDGAMNLDPGVVNGIVASQQQNLFFMPVTKILELARAATGAGTLARLEELTAVVNQRQRLQAMSADMGDGQEKSSLPAYARIFPPLSHQEIKTLSELHGLSPADVKAWSSVRVLLNSYGWLARRVGEHTVPETSIVFTAFKMPERSSETNDLGLIGRKGMIPLRGTRLEKKWGSFWRSRFTLATSAAMAETTENYERLMKGLADPRDEELAGFNSAFA